MRTTFLEKRLFSFFLSLFVLFGCFFFFWQRDRSIGFDFEFFSYSIACMILCFLFYRLLLFLFSFLKRSETGSYYSSKYVHSHGVQEVLKTSRISFRTCLKKDLEDLEKKTLHHERERFVSRYDNFKKLRCIRFSLACHYRLSTGGR